MPLKVLSPLCPTCGTEETREHMLLQCRAYVNIRMDLQHTIVALLDEHIGRRWQHPLWFKDHREEPYQQTWEQWYPGFNPYYGMCGLLPKGVARYIKENESEADAKRLEKLLNKLNSAVLDATIQIISRRQELISIAQQDNDS